MRTYMGQKVVGLTELFNKKYYWMQDGDGVVYLTKAKPRTAASIAESGDVELFNEGWVPDFS